MGLSRSTYYYHLKSKPKSKGGGRPIPGYSFTRDGRVLTDIEIQTLITRLIQEEGNCYGYLKLTHALRKRHNLIINKKKVYRLCKVLKVLMPQRKIKTRYPRKLAANRLITGPNQLWATDLKYGWLHGEGRFFFILTFLDVFDRRVVGYHIGHTCKGSEAAATLTICLQKERGMDPECKPVIRSDNGTQLIGYDFEMTCNQLGLLHERIPVRTPNKNAHIESYNSILERECLGRYEFLSFAHAYRIVSEFVNFYNTTRIHSGIKFMSPYEYSQAIKSNSIQGESVRL